MEEYPGTAPVIIGGSREEPSGCWRTIYANLLDLNRELTMNQEKSQPSTNRGESRRDFLKKAAVTPMAASLMDPGRSEAGAASAQGVRLPWYRRTYRWGQTNISEKDPIRYDVEW